MPDFLDEFLASNPDPEIIELCNNNPQCIFDAIQTGDPSIGLDSADTNNRNMMDSINGGKYWLSDQLQFPKHYY